MNLRSQTLPSDRTNTAPRRASTGAPLTPAIARKRNVATTVSCVTSKTSSTSLLHSAQESAMSVT